MIQQLVPLDLRQYLSYWLLIMREFAFLFLFVLLFLCLYVQEKDSFLPKLGLPFLMCQLELVFVPVCDFFVCGCVCISFRIRIWESGKCFFSVPGWAGVYVFVFVFVYLRRGVCLDKVGSAFPIVPAWVTLGRRLPACCKWPCVPYFVIPVLFYMP